MRELAKSMLSLPWAASVFGAQQLTNLLSADGGRKARGTFYTVSVAVQEQFATSPMIFAAYQIMDELQKSAVDLFWDVAELQILRPEWVSRTAGTIVQRSADTLRALTPGENLRVLVGTLRNTFDVINLVNGAPAMLNLPPGPINLNEVIARSYSFGDYSPLWLIEGLGQDYADRNWSDAVPVSGLLTSGQGAGAAESSLLMMHAGIGISFAKHLVRPLTPVSSKQEIASAIRRFIELVRMNSQPGYEGAAFESLGLVTHTWYPQMVPLIDELLWQIDVDVLQYFWHGAGRALYFAPLSMLPGSTAFDGVRNEAPHELGRLNATAGAAWAFSLVNIKRPEILLHLLTTYPRIARDDAFTAGLTSVITMANDTFVEHPTTDALCSWRVQTSEPNATAAWDNVVRRACEWAGRYYPELKRQHLLGEIFRYHNLNELAQRLEAGRQ